MKRLTVIGAGQMGSGIAFAAISNAKMQTTLSDVNGQSLAKGVAYVKQLFIKQVAKQRISQQQANAALGLLRTSQNLKEAVENADIVIEAVPENIDMKLSLFADLASYTQNNSTILASNTSSISLTRLAAAAKGAESRVIGLHFFNPVPVLKGAEIIRALQTSDEVFSASEKFMQAMGKQVSVSQDSPGFIANRILIPMLNEAVCILESGVGSPKDIDNIMKTGCGMPMGPLELADLVGLDTVLAITEVLVKETGDPKYRPAPMLRKLVAAGYLGRKSGRGFFNYAKL